MKKQIIKFKLKHKRKMCSEELAWFLKERSRGTGVHVKKSHKRDRKNSKQKLGRRVQR